MSETRVGTVVTHRRYVPYSHAHYAGNLVDGAYSLGLFGDVATELCIRSDGDEGLFASYAEVQFRAPVMRRRSVRFIGRRSRRAAPSRQTTRFASRCEHRSMSFFICTRRRRVRADRSLPPSNCYRRRTGLA